MPSVRPTRARRPTPPPPAAGLAVARLAILVFTEGHAAAVDALRGEPLLARHALLPATRGVLLERLGDHDGAAAEFRRALSLPCSAPERRSLARRLAALTQG